MGFLDRLLLPTTATPAPDRDLVRGSLEDAISAAIADRLSTFSMAEAVKLPAVARAVDLIVSIGSTFQPIEYLDGTATVDQPRFLRRPDPFSTRADFLAMTLAELVHEGEFYWLLGPFMEGYPASAIVLGHDEVAVDWDDRRFLRRYRWRGRELVHGQTIYHGAINRRPGDLHGRSVLKTSLPYLATLAAAEEFAASTFGAGGVPTTVLKVAAAMSSKEAQALKAYWAESRRASSLTGEPAVLSAGVDAFFPDVDPQRMQLAEARSAGAATVARLMGIPGPLLLAETSGASVTYQNVDAVVDMLTKVTILPRYLSPIESAFSDLVPRTKSVRFSMAELTRADVTTRFAVYAQAIASGVMSPTEARAFEGYPPDPPPFNKFPAYDPVPSLATDPSLVPGSEVPT